MAPQREKATVRYGSSRSRSSYLKSLLRLRTVLALALSFVLVLFNWMRDDPIGVCHHVGNYMNWDARRQRVKDVFITSWDSYLANAWGNDRYHPVSGAGSQMSPDGLGWIVIDSLDTMMLMNLTDRLAEPRKWLQRSLSYNQDQDVNTFETTIRMLGGLLSAHYLSTKLPHAASRRDSVYLAKAVELADRLLPAYESRSGIPYASVHLSKSQGIPSHVDGGSSSTAEATTLQLEMKYLSHLTGNDTYWRKAERYLMITALKTGSSQYSSIQKQEDLRHGKFDLEVVVTHITYCRRMLTRRRIPRQTILADLRTGAGIPGNVGRGLAGDTKTLITTTKHSSLKFVAELPQGIGGPLSPKMDHLVCFLPGLIALGATGGHPLSKARTWPSWDDNKEGQMQLAHDLMKTCWGMYAVTKTGLAPEIAWFNATDEDLRPEPGNRPLAATKNSLAAWKKDYIVKPLDAHNLQRPETVESLFVMWRITEDPVYREWGWKIFSAFEKYTKVGQRQGYTSVNDVNAIPPPLRDNMESFWLAETLKYLYLLFSPTDFIPLTEVVFNTEAHILPVINKVKWQTGWSRRGR
ncbi:hypothetical protein RRF57_001806 [Xylaria bambusicola]|uniref:alpha-1,2-Mannosidase n=1 Tax=Xylaria bambusicola TaxID=326684 RepID=A0AAN7Z6G3_9PEZI